MDWMELRIVVPDSDGTKILNFARENLDIDQLDEDWCTHKRKTDSARIDYAPAPEPEDRKNNW